MPTVPELTPQVAPSESGIAGPRVDAPVEAFGGAVGHALSGLGSSIEGASDKIWQRAVEIQNLDNDTKAKAADTAYMIKAGELHAQFSALEGDAARDALPKYMQDQKDAREAIRATLTNPMVQKMYDASSINFMGRNMFNAAGHAAQQTKVAASNASQSRVDTISDNIGENPEDELGFQRGVKAIRAETEAQGRLHGWEPEQISQTADANVSTAVSKRIAGLARTDPFAAQAMFDSASKAKALLPNDAQRVQATIQTQTRQAIPRGISNEVNADLDHPAPEGIPQKSLEDRIAEAESKAEPYAKNDPLLQDFVKQRVIADYSRSKAIQRDADQRNQQTIASALMTGNKEGILPKSVDELQLINPEVGAAWNSLKPTDQKKFMSVLAQNARGDKVTWTNETLSNYQKLKGQAIDDPVSFLAHDVISDNLPASGKRELINLQMRLKSQSESDPRVGRAMQVLAPDLHAAGISKKDNADSYYQFVGALQDALDAYQTNNKKVPSAEDVRTIGSRLMQEQVTSKGYLWDSKSPTFALPVPEDEADRLRKDPYWAKANITPNDDMIRRIYVAQKYKELYGGAAKVPAAAAFPPNAPVSQ